MCAYGFSCHSSSLIAENVSGHININCQALASFPQNHRAWDFLQCFVFCPDVQGSYREKSIEVKAERPFSTSTVVETRPEASS